MSYEINGRRLTKNSRVELLKLCEQLHGEKMNAIEQWSAVEHMRDEASHKCGALEEELEMAVAQRDQALHECDVLRGESDAAVAQATELHSDNTLLRRNEIERQADLETVSSERDGLSIELEGCRGQCEAYHKESTDNWLKLTTAETNLSRTQARLHSVQNDLRQMCTPREVILGFLFGAFVACLIGGAVWLS